MLTDFPQARYIETNGIRLLVHEAGEGIPLVLCHGWPELPYSWRFQIPVLVAAGYRVIIPNQRGYGGSDQPEAVEEYDIHHLCDDHIGLQDALGLDKAIYVGHDWGAIVVWNLALLHPDRVVGIANMSVPFRAREPADPLAFWEKMLGPDFYIVHFNRQPGVAAQAFDANPNNFLRNMYRTEQWLDQSGKTEFKNIVEAASATNAAGKLLMSEQELDVFTEVFTEHGFTAPCNWYRNFTRNWETTSDVSQTVTQPALMIYGEYDSVPKSKDMENYVSDLEIHTLECGHWIQQEKPEQTNQILLDWLERRMKPMF